MQWLHIFSGCPVINTSGEGFHVTVIIDCVLISVALF